MNAIREVLHRWASAHLPAFFRDNGSIYVDYSICPRPCDASLISQVEEIAYCQYGKKVCPQLQISQPNKRMILCRAAQPREIVDEKDQS